MSCRTWAVMCLVGLAPFLSLHAQPALTEIEPIRVPAGVDGVQALENALAAELQAINVEPPMGPFEEGKEPPPEVSERVRLADEWREALRQLISSLREVRGLRSQIVELEAGAGAKKLSDDVTALNERISQIRNRFPRRPRPVSDEEISRVKQELDAAQTELNARVDRQRDRRERLAQSDARKEAAVKRVQETHSELIETASRYHAQRSAPGDELAPTIGDLLIRTAQVRAGIALAELERVELEAQRDARHAMLAEQRIPVDRELVAVLQQEFDQLRRFQTQSEIDQIRATAEWASSEPSIPEFERGFYQLRLSVVDGLQNLNDMIDRFGLRHRFTHEEHEELIESLESRENRWEHFVKSLERRPLDQIRERYLQINDRISIWLAERDQKRRLADQSFDERSFILARMDEIRRSVRAQARTLRNQQRRTPTDETVLTFAPQVTEFVERLEKDCAALEKELNGVVERLDNATARIDAHIVSLAALRSRIYIAYLGVQDRQVWKYQWSKTVEEWNSERYVQAREKSLSEIKSAYQAVTVGQWALMAAVMIATLVVSFAGRRTLHHYARQTENRLTATKQEADVGAVSVSDRFHIQLADFLASTAVSVWPGLAAWGCIRFSPLDGRIAGTIVLMVVVACSLWGLISTLFSQSKPRFRLLRCSNVVARYYRRWLRAMFFVSVVFVPVPLLLYVLDWSYYTMSYLFAFYKIIMLAMLLAFATRKQTVLKVVGRPEDIRRPWVMSLISLFYPIACLALFTIFVLAILGYGPLTNYVIIGFSETAAALALAVLVWQYARELLTRLWWKVREASDIPEPLETAERESTAAGVMPSTTATPGQDIEDVLLDTIFSFLRWAYMIAVGVGILSFWGITPVELQAIMNVVIIGPHEDGRPAITVERLLVALVIVAVAAMLARTLRTSLQVKVIQALANEDRGGWIAIGTLAQYVLLLFGLYFALYVMRIPLGALTVLLGTLGLGLGLGLQPLFANFFSGLVILFERHVKVGDIVILGDGTQGQVTKISVRATTIKTPDNVDIVIPNGEFIAGRVTNWTLEDTKIRARLNVGVGYGSDPRLVERLLLQAAYESPYIAPEPPPEVRFVDFADSSLNFALLGWCRNPQDRWNFLTHTRYRILELFEQNNIEIPFPQRTLSTADDRPLRVEVTSTPTRSGREDPSDRAESRDRPRPTRAHSASD